MGGGYARVCVLHVGYAGGRQLQQRCIAIRGDDAGGGCGVGCFAGSPWREAQQSLMLSGSERVGEEKREKERQR